MSCHCHLPHREEILKKKGSEVMYANWKLGMDLLGFRSFSIFLVSERDYYES